MIRATFFIAILFIPFLCQALSTVDSLEQLLKTQLQASHRIEVLNQLAYNKRSDKVVANLLLKEAEQIANKNKLDDKLCEVYIMYAKINNFESGPQEESEMLNKAKKLSRKIGNKQYEAEVYFQYGSMYGNRQLRDSSIVYLLKSLKLSEELNDSMLIADNYWFLGDQYGQMKVYDVAQEYSDKAISLFRVLKNKSSEFLVLWGAFRNAKKTNDLESQMRYGERLVELKPEMFQKEEASNSYHNSVFYSHLVGLPDEQQIEELKEALSISQANAQQHMTQIHHELLALIYRRQGNCEDAIIHAKSSLELAKQIDYLLGQYNAFLNLHACNTKMGNYKEALTALEQSTLLYDSLNQMEQLDKISELKYKYENAENEKQIVQLENENLTQKVRMNGLIALFSLLIISLVFAVIYFVHRYRVNKKLSAQNEEINQRKLAELQKAEQIKYMNAMIEGQEAERSRIASELHDGLGGLLSTAKRYLQKVGQKKDKDPMVDKATEMLQNAYQEAREISHNMMPGALVRFGLVQAIEDLVASFSESTGTAVHFENINLNERLSKTTESMLFRIVQECLNNINKHAEAKEVLIQISKQDDQLHLTIEDDGKGFDMEAAKTKKSIGLQSIESRVKYLNGTLSIDSKLGEGTTVEVFVGLA